MPQKRVPGPRTKSGRLSRAKSAVRARGFFGDETEREATATATAARQRIFGVPADLAMLPEIGTLIGRMLIAQVVTRPQFEAAVYWLTARNNMLRAIDAKIPIEPSDGAGSHFPDDAVMADVMARLREKYSEIEAVVLSVPSGLAALEAFLVREEHVPALVLPLARALDAIDGYTRRPLNNRSRVRPCR